MDNPFIYIFINGELKMSAGKATAQAVHALAELSNHQGLSPFASQTKRTVIVLEAKNQQQIDNLQAYLSELEIDAATYIDEGHNEVEAYSVTAMAVGPIDEDDFEKRDIFAAFPLYPAKKRWFKR